MNIRIEREDNGKNGRFLIYEENSLAGEMTYVWAGNKSFIIEHTEVDEAFGGQGYAKMLVLEAVKFARENNYSIHPLCPYARRVFDKDTSIQDVRA